MSVAMGDTRKDSSAVVPGRRPGRLGTDSLSAYAEDTRSNRGVASDRHPSGATHPVGVGRRASAAGAGGGPGHSRHQR